MKDELTSPLSPSSEDKQQQKNKEKCHKFCRMYQKKFRDIEYLSSEELMEIMTNLKHSSSQNDNANDTTKNTTNNSNNNVVLVDVRTKPERDVSMLEGALSKEEFAHKVNNANASALPENAQIITYCTIGYRSGLEARRLQMQYPQFKDRIKSMDGIVSFTHALGEHKKQQTTTNSNNAKEKESNPKKAPPKLLLFNPQTGQPTNHVHTFGSIWGFVDHRNFEATHFSIPELLLRLIQVSGAIISCYYLQLKLFCVGISRSFTSNSSPSSAATTEQKVKQ